MNTKYIIAAVVVIVLLIVATSTMYNPHTELMSDWLYGYWVGDSTFCEDTNISSILLFIGDEKDPSGSTAERPAYIIINNNIANQPLDITYKKPSKFDIANMTNITNKVQPFSVDAHLEFSDEDIDIPSEVTLELDVSSGRLRMHDGETMYGIFYKDHEVTNVLAKN